MEDDDTTITSNHVPILQEVNSSTFQLWVELLENLVFITQDDFLVDDDEFEDDTLEEYDDEAIEIVNSDISSEMSSASRTPLSFGLSSDGFDSKGKRIREETRGIAIEKELR
ncbi:hypothetical protein PanWU01x14_368300 [Parasponia andersonii]|uniref:Uncharacterized protein n=1 Tax=Parasponia andersonii TaxID=3476 RepID=A0A2P5A537_PARAD|nr:hypothetical protein PanWU01x14_368300 [Parasponia andersonii]